EAEAAIQVRSGTLAPAPEGRQGFVLEAAPRNGALQSDGQPRRRVLTSTAGCAHPVSARTQIAVATSRDCRCIPTSLNDWDLPPRILATSSLRGRERVSRPPAVESRAFGHHR